jgi:hypothetical protein
MSTKVPPPSVTAGDNANIEYGQQHVRGRKNVAVGPGGRITGSFNKKLSFRIGTIKVNLPLGPVAVAAVILLGGGGTAAVVAQENTAPSALVKQAAGTWTLARS